MKLYLVQHGSAKAKSVDPDRPLTDDGAADVNKVASFLKPLGLNVGAVWHSGKTRAAQTAEILAEAVESKQGTLERPGIGPKDPIEPVVEEVEAAGQDLMVVGHLPFLGNLASRLLAGSESAGAVAFQYGGVVCLETGERGGWSVRWMVVPELLP